MGFLDRLPAVPVYRADSKTNIKVYKDRIVKGGLGPKTTHPLAGVTASVEQGSDLEKRYTATRIALLGPFALAAPKKRGGEKWLLISGPEFTWTFRVEPKQIGAALKLAGDINRLAAASETQG